MCNLTKFAHVYGAQSGNMYKVDHQALSYVKVLSETHLYARTMPVCKSHVSFCFNYSHISDIERSTATGMLC